MALACTTDARLPGGRCIKKLRPAIAVVVASAWAKRMILAASSNELRRAYTCAFRQAVTMPTAKLMGAFGVLAVLSASFICPEWDFLGIKRDWGRGFGLESSDWMRFPIFGRFLIPISYWQDMLVFGLAVTHPIMALAVAVVMAMPAELVLMREVEITGRIVAHLESAMVTPKSHICPRFEAAPIGGKQAALILTTREMVITNTKSQVATPPISAVLWAPCVIKKPRVTIIRRGLRHPRYISKSVARVDDDFLLCINIAEVFWFAIRI